MARKKRLKTNGAEIVGYSVENYKFKDRADKKTIIDGLRLKITTEDGVYQYDIHADDGGQSIEDTKIFITHALSATKGTFKKIEVSEYAPQSHLFFKAQGFDERQYTGYRI